MRHDPVPDDERSLVERAARDGDMRAFEALYRRYVERIHAYAYRRTGSAPTADDVTSSTFEQALRNLRTFRWRGKGFAPWLFRIASNELAEHFRAAKRAGRTPPSDPVPALLEDQVLDEIDAQELRTCIAKLRPRYQEAIALRYLAGLTAIEAADAMGIPKGLLAVTLHRAIGALRKELGR